MSRPSLVVLGSAPSPSRSRPGAGPPEPAPPEPSTQPAPADLGPLRRVIVQPTGYCNIDCSYCYLPDRERRTRMPLEVVEHLGRVLAASDLLADEVEVRWHAGEPLTVHPDFYDRACRSLRDALAERTRVRFSVQTNGTLVDDRWCELFARHDVEVGVSIDGPAHLHDAHRRTRKGAGTFARAMRGVQRLRDHGLPVGLISVVTPATLRHQDDFVRFVAEVAPDSIGLNPEESEGEHESGLFGQEGFAEAYRALLQAMYRLQHETGIVVRQLDGMRRVVLGGDLPFRNEQVEPLAMLNVDVQGNLSTFSPELLGWEAPGYDDFVLGNVMDPHVDLARWSPGARRMADEVAEGRRRCQEGCAYFDLCGGGAATNKWVENGSFASTVTGYCRTNVMAVADVVLAALEEEVAVAGEASGGGG